MANEDTGNQDKGTSPETETAARNMGWQPKDQWKGNPDNWVDASEFVKRGETFVPFLQHERKKLKGELDAERQARLQLEEQLRLTRESIEGLKTFNSEMTRERTERRKTEIAVELKAAREAEDDVRVAELQAELGEVVKKPEAKVEEKPKTNGTTQPTQPQIQPWVKSFIDGNADFFQNGRKIALFNAVMVEKRQAGDMRVGEVDGTALLNEARDEVERMLGGNQRRQAPSKTEESRSTGEGTRRGTGRGYADLPPEAQDKCDKQESRFVGKEGKAFKTQADWRKHFVTEYFGPSTAAMERMERAS